MEIKESLEIRLIGLYNNCQDIAKQTVEFTNWTHLAQKIVEIAISSQHSIQKKVGTLKKSAQFSAIFELSRSRETREETQRGRIMYKWIAAESEL